VRELLKGEKSLQMELIPLKARRVPLGKATPTEKCPPKQMGPMARVAKGQRAVIAFVRLQRIVKKANCVSLPAIAEFARTFPRLDFVGMTVSAHSERLAQMLLFVLVTKSASKPLQEHVAKVVVAVKMTVTASVGMCAPIKSARGLWGISAGEMKTVDRALSAWEKVFVPAEVIVLRQIPWVPAFRPV